MSSRDNSAEQLTSERRVTHEARRARQRARHLAERSRTSQYHQARVLILIDAACPKGRRLQGLTKLAKLDFLLRYPVFFQALVEQLPSIESIPQHLTARVIESRAVESAMIRYKYGPWDSQYYEILGALVGRGLIMATGNNQAGLQFAPTAAGRAVAQSLASKAEWELVAARAQAVVQRFGRFSGNRIRGLIYELLPDVVDRPLGSVIQ